MLLQLHLPTQSCHELLEGGTSARVAQNTLLVFLTFRHVDDRNLVRLPTAMVRNRKTGVLICENVTRLHSLALVVQMFQFSQQSVGLLQQIKVRPARKLQESAKNNNNNNRGS